MAARVTYTHDKCRAAKISMDDKPVRARTMPDVWLATLAKDICWGSCTWFGGTCKRFARYMAYHGRINDMEVFVYMVWRDM